MSLILFVGKEQSKENVERKESETVAAYSYYSRRNS